MMTRVYVRMQKKVKAKYADELKIGDIAFIQAPEDIKQKFQKVSIHTVTKKDGEFIVIEGFLLLSILQKVFPDVEFELVGPTETIIQVESRKFKPSVVFVFVVWVVLFIGTAMSIMNFHYDVGMPEVHETIHYIFTGERTSQPLWIQIPYSIGLGIGMVLFLNHWFKKRINEEPSPLEIELFKYEQDIDEYIRHYENDLNDDRRHF